MSRGTNTADVGATLREMWETRPARPRHDRKVAGVAAALARRYDIDPVLVRVGFAVAAFYGIGIALYLAGWLLLPAADTDDPLDGAATGTAPRSSGRTPSAGLIVLLVLGLLVTSGIFWGSDGGFVLPVLATLVLLFLLHRSRGQRGLQAAQEAPTVATPLDDGVVGPEEPTVVKDPLGPDPLDRGTPPAWDPLGAAPFAWDLPEPSVPEPEPAPVRRRSRVTPITLALALLGGGIAGAVVLLTSGLAGLPIVFATALAILGVGMVLGAFTRGGRGLIPVALLLALLTWASLTVRVPLENFGRGVGDISATPLTPAQVLPSYDRGAGTIDLDLSRLDLSVPAGGTAEAIRTSATIGAGDILVVVPPDADVTVRAHADLGDVRFGDTEQGGPDVGLAVVDDLGADGVRSGHPIVLDLRAGLGSVEVQRG